MGGGCSDLCPPAMPGWVNLGPGPSQTTVFKLATRTVRIKNINNIIILYDYININIIININININIIININLKSKLEYH